MTGTRCASFAAIVVVCFYLSTLGATAKTQHPAAPSISLTSPLNGSVIRGTSVTARVEVQNFKLVPPVYLNPPLLPGNQGHIHYYLDNVRNFVATRDAATATTFTFTDVAPGRHTIFAYLATSQHARFPRTSIASVSVTVVAPEARAPTSPPPELAVMGIQSRSTPQGTLLVVHVAIKHVTMVQPVFKNPPLLHGHQGHIHYALDSMANFIATRDAVTALSHPWTGVSPGRHTILVYLATSRHMLMPGTKIVKIPINVVGVRGSRGVIRVVRALPKTGGAHPRAPVPMLPLMLVGLVVLLVGATMRGIRRQGGS